MDPDPEQIIPDPEPGKSSDPKHWIFLDIFILVSRVAKLYKFKVDPTKVPVVATNIYLIYQ